VQDVFLSSYLLHPFTRPVQVSLYEVGPSDAPGRATVRHVRLSEEGEAPTAVELQDALPLEALLAPVGACKDAIVAAVDTLLPEPFLGDSAGEPEELHGGRAFGGAIQARSHAPEPPGSGRYRLHVSVPGPASQVHMSSSQGCWMRWE